MPHRPASKSATTKKASPLPAATSSSGKAPVPEGTTVPVRMSISAPAQSETGQPAVAVSDTGQTGGRRQRWSPEVTYRDGQEVGHEGGVYKSKVDGNLGNRPDTPKSKWWFERRGPKLKTIDQIHNQQAATYRALALETIERAAATARFRGLEGLARTAELRLLERQIAVMEKEGGGTLEVRHVRDDQS